MWTAEADFLGGSFSPVLINVTNFDCKSTKKQNKTKKKTPDNKRQAFKHWLSELDLMRRLLRVSNRPSGLVLNWSQAGSGLICTGLKRFSVSYFIFFELICKWMSWFWNGVKLDFVWFYVFFRFGAGLNWFCLVWMWFWFSKNGLELSLNWFLRFKRFILVLTHLGLSHTGSDWFQTSGSWLALLGSEQVQISGMETHTVYKLFMRETEMFFTKRRFVELNL